MVRLTEVEPLDVKPLSEHSFGSSDVVADPFDRTRRSTLTRARVRDHDCRPLN